MSFLPSIQANLLEESLCFSRGLEKNERATLRKCLATIRESKVRTIFVVYMFHSQQVLNDLTDLSFLNLKLFGLA